MKFIQARNYAKGNRTADSIKGIVLHTMEAPEGPATAENIANWFKVQPAHKTVDPATGKEFGGTSTHYNCLTPETRVLHDDLSWRRIGDVVEENVLASTQEYAPKRNLIEATVMSVKRQMSECLRVTMSDERVVTCTLDHRWLALRWPDSGKAWEWMPAEELTAGMALCAPFRPWRKREDRDAGYLEGIFDGEGTWTGANEISFSQKRGAVLDRALRVLDESGIPYRTHHRDETGVTVISLSGLQATLQALGQFRPGRLMRERRWLGRMLHSRTYSNRLYVADVERIGRREVVALATSTRTFFAEGIVSHNCDADSIVQSVHEHDVAWHAGPANGWSIGVELAGYARQDPAGWADPYSRAMLDRAAALVADVCVRYGIPIRRLEAADLARGERRGIFGHVDVTMGLTNGRGHFDPGAHFPWDGFLQQVAAYAAQAPAPPLVVDPVRADPSPLAPDGMVRVLHDGQEWLVAPTYFGPVKIGEAKRLASAMGCELPTPGLVDAIWRAADLRVSPALTIQAHDGSESGMNSPEINARVAAAIASAVGERGLAADYRLLAGAFKDVVEVDGRLGIYGWHVEDRASFDEILRRRLGAAVPLHAPETPGPGLVVQPPYFKHAAAWGDYSQAFRPVRRA